MNRRAFLQTISTAALGGVALLGAEGCAAEIDLSKIPGKLSGPDAKLGHRLRSNEPFPSPTKTIETDVVIIGAGISGLSAARRLSQEGSRGVLLLELESRHGGNASYGRGPAGLHPLGAHYLPIPDARNTELLDFLQETGVITGYNAPGIPVYNEYHLCHAPEERLFRAGRWTEGLVPRHGLSREEERQTARFFRTVESLRSARGSDGKDAFAIPLRTSSTDENFRRFDRLSFADYLRAEGYTAAPLLWYLDYCCRDDYGAPPSEVSAWAGLHYFAARKGTAANAAHDDVLTWPQGTGALADALYTAHRGSVKTGALVHRVWQEGSFVFADVLDGKTGEVYRVRASAAVLAVPAHVARRVADESLFAEGADATGYPWIITNLTVDALPQKRGEPLCWDNVLYGTRSVGYVYAQHQSVSPVDAHTLTHYRPLTGLPRAEARRLAQTADRNHWLREVVEELDTAHPGIARHIRHADVWVWGHGMAAPAPGFLRWAAADAPSEQAGSRIHLAHTDWCGMSIFEEAFYAGLRAADAILSA